MAMCCLSLLHCLDKINVEKAVDYIVSCRNLDGGFGCTPGAESHAGQSMLCSIHSVYIVLLHYITHQTSNISIEPLYKNGQTVILYCKFFSIQFVILQM